MFLRRGSSFHKVKLKLSQVVASMDWPEVSKYTCLVSSQGHREEIIAELFTEVKDPQKGVIYAGVCYCCSFPNVIFILYKCVCCRELLLSFYKANKSCKPGRIIFYRLVKEITCALISESTPFLSVPRAYFLSLQRWC